jgi:hypothetical protein
MKNNKVNPVGLKGNEINQRMIELMGIKPIVENKSTSVVELTKLGPDGKVYGIVRENHDYYIKVTDKTSGLISEDFKYIGGLQNKKSEVYPSYAKAIKHLNLNFKSLAEAHGRGGDINIFEDDKLLAEDIAGFSQMEGLGFSGQGNLEGNELMEEEDINEDWGEEPGYSDVPKSSGGKKRWDTDDDDDDGERDDVDEAYDVVDEMLDKKAKPIEEEDDIKLTEMEQAVEDMLREDDDEDEDVVEEEKNIYEHKFTISKALENMDSIIESLNIIKKKV